MDVCFIYIMIIAIWLFIIIVGNEFNGRYNAFWTVVIDQVSQYLEFCAIIMVIQV